MIYRVVVKITRVVYDVVDIVLVMKMFCGKILWINRETNPDLSLSLFINDHTNPLHAACFTHWTNEPIQSESSSLIKLYKLLLHIITTFILLTWMLDHSQDDKFMSKNTTLSI